MAQGFICKNCDWKLKPGELIQCDDIRKGPYYCPGCKEKLTITDKKGDMEKKFWMVLKDAANASTFVRHLDYEEAAIEAERLCRKEGVGFYLLEAKCKVGLVHPPLVWTDLEE